eukprot:s863_g20.t1
MGSGAVVRTVTGRRISTSSAEREVRGDGMRSVSLSPLEAFRSPTSSMMASPWPGDDEALFDALQQVFAKTFATWSRFFFGRPPLVTLPPNLVKLLFWMDRPAESVLEALPGQGLAALGGGSSLQMKDESVSCAANLICATFADTYLVVQFVPLPG